MINLKLIATLLTEKPSSVILFNIYDSTYIVTSEIEIRRAMSGNMLKGKTIVKGIPEKLKPFVDNPDDYANLFDYSKNYLDDMVAFINLYKNDFSCIENVQKLTFVKFVKFIKEFNLYDKWIEFFEKSISYDVYYWCLATDQYEEEADAKQYSQIIKLLKEYKKYEFEKCIPDRVLFSIFDDYDAFSFIVLGNAGITRGINFILGYDAYYYFKILQSENSSNVDLRILNGLSNLISFYTDGSDDEIFENNPFSKNKEFSCVQMVSGFYAKNRLSKSVANLCIKYLTKATNLLRKFVNSESMRKIDSSGLFYVNEKLGVTDVSIDNKIFIPIDISRDYLCPIQNGIIGNKSIDFKLCGINSYLLDENDPRIIFPSIMLFLCNHETGKIEKLVLGKPNMYHPLLSLSECIYNELKDYRIPKIINVNNMYDEFFARMIFEKFISKKAIKINFVNHRLLVDDAVDDFLVEFEKMGPDIAA